MRRTGLLLLLACLAVGLLAPGTVAAQADLKILVNGEPLKVDVAPFIDNGRTLVPLRAIFEAIGAQVEWNGETRTVTGTRRGKQVVLTIDSADAAVGGQPVQLAVPAKIKDGRTFVPLRFVAEAMGAYVDWDGETRTVMVVDLDYATQGKADPAYDLLLQAIKFKGSVDGDVKSTLWVGPAGEQSLLEGTITGGVRGQDAYFKLEQMLFIGSFKVPGRSELAARDGNVYLKRAGESEWKVLGQGSGHLNKLDLPGGLDPARPFASPLVNAIKGVNLGEKATVDGQEYQTLNVVLDDQRLRPFMGALAGGFGKTLEGVTIQGMTLTLQVRTADGYARKVEMAVNWQLAETDKTGQTVVTAYQFKAATEWTAPAGPIQWPALPQ